MQGHIHKRVRKDKSGKERTLWYVVVDAGTDQTGRRRQKWHGSFRTRRDAEVARAKLVDDLHSGSYVAPGQTTLSEGVSDSWLPTMGTRVKPSTLHSYRRNLEIHVLPTLGGKKLQQLSPVMLNGLYATLASPTSERDALSPKTIRYIHTTIHKALADAADADLIQRNPAERAKPPRVNGGSSAGVASWDTGELSTFLEAVRDLRLGPIWRLAAMTGMRRGEVLGLRWADVDLDAARLSIRHALVGRLRGHRDRRPRATTLGSSISTTRRSSSFVRIVSTSRKNGSSGAPTTRIRTWSSLRRTASRSTRTPSASPSSASSPRPGCGRSGSTTSVTRTPASRSSRACPSR